MTVWLQVFNQSGKGVWQFHSKLAIKVARGYDSLTANWQSYFHTSLTLLKESFSLFSTLKIEAKLDWKFIWNFHETFIEKCQCNMKVSLQVFNQSGRGVWKFHWKFPIKVARGYDSLTANWQSKWQGGMKVWLQTGNQSGNGIWKFDYKLSHKLSNNVQKMCKNAKKVFVDMFLVGGHHKIILLSQK